MVKTKCNKRSIDDIDCPIDSKRIKLDYLLLERVSKTNRNSNCNVENHNTLTNESHDVEYLVTPVKLDIDHKDYRAIKLKNGLIALLISDNNNVSKSNDEQQIHQFSTNIQSEKIDSKSEDTNQSFDQLQSAYCSLCINVGSFSDPTNIQGLAHLLEHMIPMGCEKYPKENDFDSFIQKRSGACNAFTGAEKTTFYFEIPNKYLLEAMDRFANIFISPLITKDTIVRECQAIESEFKLVQQLDTSRVVQIKHSFLKDDNPASKFSWGNLKSLENNINIHELHSELHKFLKRHYSAHRMTIAIQASKTLNELEKFVRDCFSHVPVNYLPPDDFSRFFGKDCFDTSKFKKIYSIKNIKDTSEIELNWIMPPMHHLYKSKPLEYIFHLFSQIGEGSLFHLLHKKMWCAEIYNGAVESFEHTSMYSLFSINFDLTDEGFDHLEEILNLIFSYIKLLQMEGASKSLFEHIKRIREEEFRSCFEEDNENFIKIISQNMHHYASIDYLNGYDLFLEYNPEAIQSCVDALCPENVNIIVTSKKFNDKELTEVEPWFQTKYSSKEIPEEWIVWWKSIKPVQEFKLFIEKNNFKNTTSPFDQADELFTERFNPVKIECINGIELWQKESQNTKFSIHLHLILPNSTESPLKAAITHLLVIILNYITKGYLTDKLHIYISMSISGILLEFIGHDGESLLLLKTQILTDLKNLDHLLTESLFNQVKRELLKMYYNCFIDPCKLSIEVWLSIITSAYWISNEKYEALYDINYNQFISFIKDFPTECFIQCLIKGNLTDEESLKYIYESIHLLPCYFQLLKNKPTTKSHKFALGEKCCQVKNFNNADSNTVVTNYYQTGSSSVKISVICHLITVIMQEPLFNHLRTQEQLGYKITCAQHFTCGVSCLSVSVVTQANKFTAAYIDERITNFLNGFSHTLKNMSEEELIYAKENYMQSAYNLSELNYSDSAWGDIFMNQYVPGKSEEELKIIKDITIRDIYEYFVDCMIAGPNYRKLSVQVVGTPDSDSLNNENDDLDPKKYSLIFSTEIIDEEKRKSDYYIHNIKAYSQQLERYS